VSKAGYRPKDADASVGLLTEAFTELDLRTFKIFSDVDDEALADQGKIVRARLLTMLLLLKQDAKLAKKISKALKGFDPV
jgi:hypothetical protein